MSMRDDHISLTGLRESSTHAFLIGWNSQRTSPALGPSGRPLFNSSTTSRASPPGRMSTYHKLCVVLLLVFRPFFVDSAITISNVNVGCSWICRAFATACPACLSNKEWCARSLSIGSREAGALHQPGLQPAECWRGADCAGRMLEDCRIYSTRLTAATSSTTRSKSLEGVHRHRLKVSAQQCRISDSAERPRRHRRQ